MSHIVTMAVKIKDMDAFKKACDKLGLSPRIGQHKADIFGNGVACDASVNLPGWRYPIAIVGDEIKYDNYSNQWGQQIELDKLVDEYTKEITMQEAKDMGFFVEEKRLQDGTIELYLTE